MNEFVNQVGNRETLFPNSEKATRQLRVTISSRRIVCEYTSLNSF